MIAGQSHHVAAILRRRSLEKIVDILDIMNWTNVLPICMTSYDFTMPQNIRLLHTADFRFAYK